MNKKSIIVMIVVALVVGGVAFYAGTKFRTGRDAARFNTSQNAGQRGMNMNMRGRQTGGMVNGSIVAKDDTSITVKLPTGGSKIVFFTDSTLMTKNTTASNVDLTINENVMVNGSVNTDGSVNAQSIHIGSPMPMRQTTEPR